MDVKNKSYIFQASAWEFTHEDVTEGEKDIKKFVIRLYGTTDDNKKIFVKVTDFTPYFFVAIPKAWKKQTINMFVEEVKKRVHSDHRDQLSGWDVVEKHSFDEFKNEETSQYVRLIFYSFLAMRKYSNVLEKKIFNRMLSKNAVKYQQFESNIEPFLRCMHIRDLRSCGWIKIDTFKDLNEDPPSHNDINISAHWKKLNYHQSSAFSPFIIASFDIECTSGDGTFPQPQRDEDKIIQIGTVFSRYGEQEPFLKHIITLKSCAKLKNTTVEAYDDEGEVLVAWTELIRRMNPDIVTGYNIFGFDYKYLEARAKKLGVYSSFCQLGRIKNEPSEFVEKKLESSALGVNLLYYFAMQGRVQIDLYKDVMRNNSLSSYTLDNVAAEFIRGKIAEIIIDAKKNTTVIKTKDTYGLEVGRFIKLCFNDGLSDNSYKNEHKFKIIEVTPTTITINDIVDGEVLELKKYTVFWCSAKDDVKPNDIFKLQNEGPKQRAIIAEYCLQDCVLVIKLINKLQVITNNIGMANVCHVPFQYIFLRGQGVKVFSLVAKKCRERDYLLPLKRPKRDFGNNNNNAPNQPALPHQKAQEEEPEEEDTDGYEGATVFEPNTGVHFEYIPVLDYASLYPSSMIHRNLSHECLVLNDKYDNLPGYKYENVTFFNKNGTTQTCRYAKSVTGKMGILPEILTELLAARKKTKKLMEEEKDYFQKGILNSLQLAYKITANSLYGQCGAKTSPIYLREIAASTTATGREMLMSAKKFAEEVFPKLIEPILEDDYDLYSERINHLFDTSTCGDVSMFPDHRVDEKKFINEKKKHTCRKDFIDYFYVTIGQLLKGLVIKPVCIYGDSVMPDTPVLLRKDGQVCIKTIDDLTAEWKAYKEFKPFDTNRRDKQQNKHSIDYEVWSDAGWTKIKRVIRHKCDKKIYRVLTHSGVVDVTEDHSLLDKNGAIIKPTDCKFGTELLHSYPIECVDTNDNFEATKYRSKIQAMKKYHALKTAGHNVSIDVQDNVYILTPGRSANYREIKRIDELGKTTGYVYDIETESGHFNAGVGELTVKNTDSVFINFKVADATTGTVFTDHAHLKIAIRLGILCGDVINFIMPFPHNLTYEKTYWPFIILKKKKYVGNLYEEDPDKCYQKPMGIVLKRRDNAPIVKIIVGGIVRSILNDKSVIKAVQFAKDELKKIVTGKYKMEKFVITKTLKSGYKDRSRIVHAVLADRMAERDPGNKPQCNDRIPYVYIVTEKEVELQGDMVETPTYVIENNLKLDYLFYITNQIMKPSIQFLEKMIVSPNKIFDTCIIKELNKRENKRPMSYYLKMDMGDESDDDEESEKIRWDDIVDTKKEVTAPEKKVTKKKVKQLQVVDHVIDEDKGGFTLEGDEVKVNTKIKKVKTKKKQLQVSEPVFDKNKGGFTLD
jgi:DNA polymerase elongation subunit (family B)